MAQNRLQFQAILETLLGEDEDKKLLVYFQPPDNTELSYPCIVYEREPASTQFADNRPYRFTQRYQVTVIDQDPDSEIFDAVARLPMTTHDRWFATDNLNHDVFTTYF